MDTESKLKLMDAENKYTKEQKELAAKLLAGQYADAMRELGMTPTKDNFVDYMRATMGETAFSKNANTVVNALSVAANAIF